MENAAFKALGIALGLGLLVGLQRERYHSKIAGIRTFTLITIFGSVSAMISKYFEQSWIIAVGGLSVAWLLGVANYLKKNEKESDIGQTTEIAALVMFAVGACLVLENSLIGVVVGAMVALLLYLKQYLSKIVERLGEKDLQAIMIFVAISLVVLPILPSQDFGPYQVLNLQEIWFMVVLIVGLSIAGYFAYKWLGKDIGTGFSGILGGLISSTATSVTYSKQAKENTEATRLASFVIMAASTVAFLRVIFEVSIVAPGQLSVVAPPLLIVTFYMALISVALFFYNKKEDYQTVEPQNPAQFKTAVMFAILYAGILLAVAFTKEQFGQNALYLIAIISGLTDMDAITLSLSNMMNDGRIEAKSGWFLILMAALSNLFFKGGIIAFFGNRNLLKIILPAYGATIIAGVLVMWLWN